MSADNHIMKSAGLVSALSAGFCLLLGVVACSGGGTGNKAGAKTEKSVRLIYEVPDDEDPPASVFATAAAHRSHGTLQLSHDQNSPYTSADPRNELRLVQALESGTVPVGYLPARAWAVAGVPDFQALLAPFVLTTERATVAFASSPLATTVLKSLPRSVVGLALVPQEARRVLAVRPPTGLTALDGLRIRIVDNPQTAADMRAVGAKPVEGLSSQQTSALLIAGRLDGVESSPSSILGNGFQTVAHHLSTWSPFAKFQSIVVNRKVWDRLNRDQHKSLLAAARDAVDSAQQTVSINERQELIELCQAGIRPAKPTPPQLAEIAAAMRAAGPRLAGRPRAKKLLARLVTLPGTGVQPLSTPLPQRCTQRLPPTQTAPVGPTIPNGLYTVTISRKDWLSGGVINPDFRRSITYVTTMKNGRWYQTQSPNYPDQGPFRGTYNVHGDQLTFVMLSAGAHGQNSVVAPETVKWSYFDGKLTLRNVTVADSGSRVLYAAHPWRKIR